MRRYITIGLMILLSTVAAQGQIKIGGNVYGGGNQGEVKGSTKVTVLAGDIGAVVDPTAERPLADPQGRVFGGARMANVGGNTFVHIDGKHASDYILINYVFGGNDIAGKIGTAKAVGESVPTELEAVLAAGEANEKKNAVDDEFNSYVRISTKALSEHYTQTEIDAAANDPEAAAYGKRTTDVKPDPTAKKVYIGQLFAGGNGDFDYEQESVGGGKVKHTIYNWSDKTHSAPLATLTTDAGEVGFQLPELDKTYLEVVGGSIVYAYGGGNNATIKEKNIIHIDNPSAVVNHIWVDAAGNEVAEGTSGATDLLCTERFKEMGINTGFSFPSSGAYQIGRFFGGNNKAEMHIRPTWNLLAGKVRNLYSGGNRGKMTSPEGLLLEIKDYSTLIVDNLYGGCRMADVMPTATLGGAYTPCTNIEGYKFPNELSARTLVRGGHIHNVYGGNDVTGLVYGGSAIGIYTTVYGDVYGGGNGAYPYTDNEYLADNDVYGDFVYTPTGIAGMNAFRPNAEQVSIRLKGTDADHPTVIQGSVFVGGNCATLDTKKNNPLVELKMGSYVKADKVFLGNNGEKMISPTILETFAQPNFLSSNLKDASVFAEYMEGVAMDLQPNIVFDKTPNDPDDYEDWTSWVGSFYCGGNVGSMAIPGKSTYQLDRGLIIFDKFVGGCNNANVTEGEYNAAYEGGVLGVASERTEDNDINIVTEDGYKLQYTTYNDKVDNNPNNPKIKDRLEINLNNMVIQPMRWNDTFTQVLSTDQDLVNGKLKAGETYYATDLRSSEFVAKGTEDPATATYYRLTLKGTQLEWNTAKWSVAEGGFVSTGTGTGTTHKDEDEARRFNSGNVYGGCYNSGHVNGNVVININQDLMMRDVIFAQNKADDNHVLNGERRSGVLIGCEGDDVMPMALSVYGAGRGVDTEIWGSTTVNLNNGYTFQIFGGGEQGVVGRKAFKYGTGGSMSYDYVYNEDYSSTVNLKGPSAGYSEEESGPALAEAEYIYGGGNAGNVCGDCYVNLGNGRLYEAYGGSCNADILGSTEMYIGHNGGFPWIRDNVFGGNDFGGTVKGRKNRSSVTTRTPFDANLLTSATYVKYIQGRVDSIFGGCYGNYDYTDPMYDQFTDKGDPRPGFNFPHMDYNSFVHFQPVDNISNKVTAILGGCEGYPGDNDMNNAMQEEAYVLIDDTQTKVADRYANVDVFGGGAFAGVGHKAETAQASDALGAGRTIVDLFAGRLHNVYGGSTQEGLIGFTRVNVPDGSTIRVNSLFGGSKGYDEETLAAQPAFAARYCDTYVTCIDYQSGSALVDDGIYGGNQNIRIACDTYINIGAPVKQYNGYDGTIYGAGYGRKTVCGRTNVFMNDGSNAYKVFGGGRDGNSFNYASLTRWLYNQFAADPKITDIASQVTQYGDILRSFGEYIKNHKVALPENIGTYVDASGKYDGTHTNDIMPTQEKPMPDYHQTNVHILPGGNVGGYAYGGGYGSNAVVGGTTYVELVGGNVDRDIYGGGEGGPVFDEFGLKSFVASTNVNIESGMARNVYGGGYLGHVGKHTKEVNHEEVDADISEPYTDDVPGEANVMIGKRDGTNFMNGIPAIQRNAYGGGEGGSVYGTVNLTVNNGYIGYRCDNTGTADSPVYNYTEVVTDATPNDFENGGNVFGGGYVVNSYVDIANVNLYGGTIRGSVYGGGEVGPIGRGTVRYKDTYDGKGLVNGAARIFKAGQTHVKMYNGHVLRNVFGGGRGKDSWGGDGTKFMSDALKETVDLQCKGYVFGQTEVNIYGGEVGTNEGVPLGLGNIFGGGDEGYVYSAYEESDGSLRVGKKDGERYISTYEGYYYKTDGNNAIVEHNVGTTESPKYERSFTEDCKVLVEPWLEVKTPITYDNKTYEEGDYIPTAYLNTLKAKNGETWPSEWDDVDTGDATTERGVIIHNAVFAGGNIASGSSSMYANEKTVYGNATASIHDVYNRDFITIGTGHTGGLYGDGNLTFVDGYRELNITNYGTDYYHIATELPIETYKTLPAREKAYYEEKFKCKVACTDNVGNTYTVGSNLPLDELVALFIDGNGNSLQVNGQDIIITVEGDKVPNPEIWEENGVVSSYAGRIMNTIQRADFCGVFGSRMVMKGARDRVPEIVDYTNYTINRVREVSLNKMDTPAGDTDDDNILHGNYFGIYSIVNYLGSLTSDVDFHSVRTTKSGNTDLAADGTTTFAQWKKTNKLNKKRNNGNCHNQLALASGVYLELTTEKSTGSSLEEKDWGPITGVVELDLINVQTGIGGGFVYAKNQHGVRSASGNINTTLTALNEHAVTKWDFNYETTEDATHQMEWETSGNFIHSSQTIVDDCYNVSARYMGAGKVPAHYWFISGSVYVYDQYISAYTGAPNAYSKTVEIPITINAASHGTMTLMDVQPNLYAYYSSYTNATTNTKLEGERKLVINDVEYHLNDPISYWDWNKLSAAEKRLFVEDTYIVKDSCKIGDQVYPEGAVLLSSEYNSLKTAVEAVTAGDAIPSVLKMTVDTEGHETAVKDNNGIDVYVAFTDAFRSSNNMSHDTGYLLTYNMTNPSVWKEWYTQVYSAERKKSQNPADLEGSYEDGPTYHPKADGLYGQHEYAERDIISKEVYDTYQAALTTYTTLNLSDQATFERAWVTNEYIEVMKKNKDNTETEQHIQAGSALVSSDYSAAVWESISSKVAEAYVCTSTILLDDDKYIPVNELLTGSQKSDYISSIDTEIRKLRTTTQLTNDRLEVVTKISDLTATELAGLTDDQKKRLSVLLTQRSEVKTNIVEAYYCTEKGLYGGDYYLASKNYRALSAWSSMSEADRNNFIFNYDALDLLIDPAYGGTAGRKYQYDGKAYDYTVTDGDKAKMIYSLAKPIDYTATYNGTSAMTYTDASSNSHEVAVGAELLRADYETLPNEQRHYSAIKVDQPGEYYVVNSDFVHIETPYAVGTVLDSGTYGRLTDTEKQAHVTTLNFTEADMNNNTSITFYYCRESYQVNEKGEGESVTSVKGEGSGTTYNATATVPVGAVINAVDYANLPNKQKGFTIHGVSPMETSTLFVSLNSDINDLSKEKIITVIYKYDYEESDADGMHITPVSERHVVNIHVTFESGVPTVDDIQAPAIVLPGTSITMKNPHVEEGAYVVIGGGWELFEKSSDAESHTNGKEYAPSDDPLYWYQDGFYLAYYAKTYLGKTYSNAVPVRVANYHDLKKVMDDANHLYVDYDRTRLKRDSKIYINDYSGSLENGLDLFKDFYDLSVDKEIAGRAPLNTSTETGTNIYDGKTYAKGVKAGTNLDFFLRTDIDHSASSWEPIGSVDNPSTTEVNEAQCFEGTLHGDGHTIKGLDKSLFKNLCGSVYNLGVTGSFSSAGVVDTGDGYVENCWINTTGNPDGTVYAVFGEPTDEVSTTKQLVNSYYQEGKTYKTTASAHGVATAKPKQSFYNGEVAYDLNGFYLYKRYNDNAQPGGTTTYQYWLPGNDTPQDGTYAQNEALCSSGYNGVKYVEERFGDDGDFRFAGGTIPGSEDERHYVETITDSDGKVTEIINHYCPIWPDDYLFFGQKLTYGYSSVDHQPVPTAIAKDGGRLAQGGLNNRVYRAPAYFQSKVMGVAHFNPDAYLAAKSADGTEVAYPRMTAIDFAGHEEGFAASAFQLGTQSTGFYPPMLDDDGLLSIVNEDETQNLLVYAPAATAESGYANQKTYNVLNAYFEDPAYSTYYDDSDPYRRVQPNVETVYGHLVQSDLKATNDHLLVDRQDFNAPIAYDFDGDHLMWYQRLPDNYVDIELSNDPTPVRTTKGWEGISIPFQAELVTTHQKGEITHFYKNPQNSNYNEHYDSGHEYWLRGFTGIVGTSDNVTTANLVYPTGTGNFADNKLVKNTFLWDYYYSANMRDGERAGDDKHYDVYQKYYSSNREYAGYPLLSGGTAYIIGFPSDRYYEFDLSGTFIPSTTAPTAPAKLDPQIITFASNKGASIAVSDDEEVRGHDGYTFKPNYLNQTLTSVVANDNTSPRNYVLNAAGTAYEAVVHAQNEAQKTVSVNAFRPYFTTANSLTRTIDFGNEQSELKGVEEHGDPTTEELNGGLHIYVKKDKIYVRSTLSFTEDLRVVTPAGITVATFSVKSGQTVEVEADFSGMYIVHTLDGLYTKKVAVRNKK